MAIKWASRENGAVETAEEVLGDGTEYHAFGVFDEKGREVGAFVCRSRVTYGPVPADACGWIPGLKPGTYFELTVGAARAGKPFGASQGSRRKRFVSAEALEKGAATYLAGARKRAEKLAANAAAKQGNR